MDRKDFLSTLGFSAASLVIASCMGGCSKESAAVVDFTIDISLPAYAALNAPGGYIYSNGVIVAKTSTGSTIAVSQACTHESAAVQYQNSSSRFYCPRHGATFSTTGAVTRGPASTALKQYTVTITGTNVRVNG